MKSQLRNIAVSMISLLMLAGCGNVGLPSTDSTVGDSNVNPVTDENSPQAVENERTISNTFPLTLENCGLTITIEQPPERAVTMNQSATEVMLALGLQDKMVGTAYIDDEILPEYQATYQQIPVLAEQYPSQELLFEAEPDFIYGAFGSAFGDEAAGPREELKNLGITPYLSPSHCEDKSLRPQVASMNNVYGEIMDIGRIFGIEERANTLVDQMKAQLEQVQSTIASVQNKPSTFWYDSGDDEPYTGVGTGVPNVIMELAGAENIFADVPGAWENVSWEEIITRDPEAIVIIEADWSTAQEKIELLTNNPAYASIKAVQNQRFIIIPFSYTTAGIRNAAAAQIVAEGLYPDLFNLKAN